MTTKHFTSIVIGILLLWVLYEIALRIGLLSFFFYPDDDAIRKAVLSDLEQSGTRGVLVQDIASYEGKAFIDLLFDGHEISVVTDAYNTFATGKHGFSMPRIDGIGIRCWDEEYPDIFGTPNLDGVGMIANIEEPGSISSVILHFEEIQERIASIAESEDPVEIYTGRWCAAS